MSADSSAPVFDLAIIGGGINGTGIARAAAGCGASVFLCEARDLASATSSASTKLIHGGLRYLEYREFRLVREALREREVLWGLAPHIIRPLRFVLPHHKGLRPAWLLRLGLLVYDHLGGRKRLPPTSTRNLRRHAVGRPLKPAFTLGFEYSDCWVDDARLVVLNARDAADRGATIAPRTRCIAAEREHATWRLTLQSASGGRSEVRARTLVNAAGPWVAHVARAVAQSAPGAGVRLVQGSHIVVPRLYPADHSYVFQNADGRIIFVIPYETDFTLIGTTDRDFRGDPTTVQASAEEIAYLCSAASEYLRKPVTPGDVVWSYSGVRPLYDDGASKAQEATRDYVLELDAPPDAPPLLSVYGGKITTYRRLAEAALTRLLPYLPQMTHRNLAWTARHSLPGGDFGPDGFDGELARAQRRWPFVPAPMLRRLLRAYGTCVSDLLGGAASLEDLGTVFGANLTEAEIRYLVRREWAMTAEDIVWRRTKLGLRLSQPEIACIDEFLQGLPTLRDHAA